MFWDITRDSIILATLNFRGPGRVLRDTAALFKGIRDTFENNDWNFRDTKDLDLGDTCSNCYLI